MSQMLLEVLADHQEVGAIGRRVDLSDLVEQSLGFLSAAGPVPEGAVVVDLGSGGGVPALPILDARPDLRLLLVERRGARAALLRGAVRRLGAEDRATVIEADARALAVLTPEPAFVVARCAGPASAALTLAAGLVVAGSVAVTSAPPDGPQPDPPPAWDAGGDRTIGRWRYFRWSRR